MGIKSAVKRSSWLGFFSPERFHLLWYYSVASFIVIAGISFLIGQIFASMEKRELIKRSEAYGQFIATNLNRALYEEFLLPILKAGGKVDLANDLQQRHRLDRVIESHIYGLNLKKVYFYDMQLRIVYSTVSKHIGWVIERGRNSRLDLALGGVPVSFLQPAGRIDEKGVWATEDLLESYYPFRQFDPRTGVWGKQVGVIEVYQNMRHLERQIRAAGHRAIGISLSAMGTLFLVLLGLVKQADRIIRLRTDQLTDAKERLEQRVAERTLEIERAYRELQEAQQQLVRSEKLAALGTLAAGVAHEINNPLSIVAGCAEGLLSRSREENLSRIPEFEDFPSYLRTIEAEAYRCKAITSKLLDFARQSNPRPSRVEIHHLIEETVAAFRQHYPLSRQEIRLDLYPDPIYLWADGHQLRQVIVNLLTNALDALEDGSGEVAISTRVEGEEWWMVFQDTGCGISSDHLSRLFDPFFTTKPPGKGTGLGLSLCYGIIEEHGGRLEASSPGPGKGCSFKVVLNKL
ncbi:MAG: hypothetical protein HYY20_04030 [Candidatus Tectomicrobia bacterium]|uniref:histidine kinase n=1 Tax=Tectimicrobiota bacterium TaxID=2528274 RepID=A0A932FW21_UNCTE|nr:hypothetical protein [Candidatus Tectomicrobia bacterium]